MSTACQQLYSQVDAGLGFQYFKLGASHPTAQILIQYANGGVTSMANFIRQVPTCSKCAHMRSQLFLCLACYPASLISNESVHELGLDRANLASGEHVI